MNVGVVIQARMQSTRLPGKVMLELPVRSGKTLLDRIIERLPVDYPIVIATSQNPADDPIILRYPDAYRGSEENVLERFYEVAINSKFDHIVRLTGDNPCIDAEYLVKSVKHHLETSADYTSTSGLPLGCNFEIFSFNGLEMAKMNAHKSYEKEHVTPYMKDHGNEMHLELITFKDCDLPANLRLTVDYPSDFAMMNILFSTLGGKFSLNELSLLLKESAWIADINSENEQKS